MNFYRKLRSINVDTCLMKIFCIESVLTFSFICWFGSLNLKNRKRLKHMRICSKIAGVNVDELALLYGATVKAQAILANCAHPPVCWVQAAAIRSQIHSPRLEPICTFCHWPPKQNRVSLGPTRDSTDPTESTCFSWSGIVFWNCNFCSWKGNYVISAGGGEDYAPGPAVYSWW